MKTSIDINSGKVSRRQLFRQLVEVQIELTKFTCENTYSQDDEARTVIQAIDRLLQQLIDE